MAGLSQKMTDPGDGDDEFQFLRTVSEPFLNLPAIIGPAKQYADYLKLS